MGIRSDHVGSVSPQALVDVRRVRNMGRRRLHQSTNQREFRRPLRSDTDLPDLVHRDGALGRPIVGLEVSKHITSNYFFAIMTIWAFGGATIGFCLVPIVRVVVGILIP